MPQTYTAWKSISFVALWFAALAGSLSVVAASETKFVGSQTCNSVSCHGRTEPRRVSGGVNGASLQEFALYERHDPHVKAAKTLASPEFQAIIGKLSERPAGPTRATVYHQCAQCHDPEGMAAEAVPSSAVSHGISCETCHGGGKGWLAQHYERDVSRSSLVALGMRDTKDLHVRGDLCASCHVGGALKNVNHDMLAAGHPPLRFELAAYHRKLTSHDEDGKRSHWNDARERIGTKDLEVKLWEAGQIASAKAALALLESRAHAGASWPEFAEYDCFSCHQRLRPSDGNRRAVAGLPQWGQWNLVFAGPAADSKVLNTLRDEMRQSFASQPHVVKVAASNVRKSLGTSLFLEDATSSQLLKLPAEPSEASKSWEALCQRYLAQRVLEKSIGDEFRKLELAGRISTSDRVSFNKQRGEIDHDLAAVGLQLSFADNKREWPRVLAIPQGIEQVESDLTATAGKLRMLQAFLEPRR